MDDTRRIILVIGGILRILGSLLFLTFGIWFLSIAAKSYRPEIIEMIDDGSIVVTHGNTVEAQARFLQNIFRVFGIIFLIYVIPFFISGIVAFNASNRNNATLLKVTLFLGAICLSIFLVSGSILGLYEIKHKDDYKNKLL